jgi:hypothetical protein
VIEGAWAIKHYRNHSTKTAAKYEFMVGMYTSTAHLNMIEQ